MIENSRSGGKRDSEVVSALVAALGSKDSNQVSVSLAQLISDPAVFQSAVPSLVSQFARSSNEEIQASLARLMYKRAHWIPSSDCNEFLVPTAVMFAPLVSDKSIGDFLIATALWKAPELSQDNACLIAESAHRQMRDEQGNPITYQSSIGLLGERMPLALAPLVGEATRRIIQEYSRSLEGAYDEQLRGASDELPIEHISLSSLFAQRRIIGGNLKDGGRLELSNVLSSECRRYLKSFRNLCEEQGPPGRQESYQLLMTAALVLPQFDSADSEALAVSASILRGDLPKVSELVEAIAEHRNFCDRLLDVVRSFDPQDAEQSLLFVAALMDTILRLEKGEYRFDYIDARRLEGALERASLMTVSPLLAYFAAELRRILLEHISEEERGRG